MVDDFSYALLKRSLGARRSDRSIKTLYGHKSWVEDLDIVNELGGHNGCVNALSWSSTGALLASGSDDTFVNIWSYNPTNLAKPFTLNTSVSTGHRANIFSVKFMPHSGDRTVVSCAGDHEVRVFDLDYSGLSGGNAGVNYSSSTSSRRFQTFFAQARWLSDANTNARVYRCHSDRVKRIVTESSPFLFLTCSEDGEVRQWDLRLPSSAYPAPREGRMFGRFRQAPAVEEGSGSIPPPLISYKKYNLDLNSISCAASRPHYIALGGAHLHCFLHDRRMLGRDLACEAGQPRFGTSKRPVAGTHEDELMSSATRCVRRFAPNGRRRMSGHDHGHITACKISDANPNEMVVSWSGDHVYSFDLIKSPDARDADARNDEAYRANHAKNHIDRRRKRKRKLAAEASSSSLAENPAPPRRLRRVSDSVQEAGLVVLRVRNEDESEDENDDENEDSHEETASVADLLLGEAHLTAERVARGIVRLRKTLFDFSALLQGGSAEEAVALMTNPGSLTAYTSRFTDALGQSASLISQLDEIIRSWSYPVDPSSEEVTIQNTLRRNRQSTWRFVQASGCLSYTLGGTLQTSSEPSSDALLSLFRQIRPAVHEGKTIGRDSMFCYDFLKAILCWIDGGAQAVLHAFTRPPTIPVESPRFPLSETDTAATFIPKLHQYLYELADESKPLIDLDTNPFEHDERRQVFESQKSAVQAFTRALEGIELRMGQGLSSIDMSTTLTGGAKRVMDKGSAARFWVVKVGRSLLMEAAEGVTFDFVNRAFGGLMHRQARVDTEGDVPDEISEGHHDDDEDDEDDDNDDDNDSDDVDDDDDDDDDDVTRSSLRRRIAFDSRSRERALVNRHVPYSSHSRTYKGHCNTRTVKDVNYYGLNDEYVVSGSDDGMFFIWDRKSSKIVNILEGDGEVVNVIQGHPYEPMIACSGIDSTIKIFGPGGMSRERRNAAMGIDIANPSGTAHSSLGRPLGQWRQLRRQERERERERERGRRQQQRAERGTAADHDGNDDDDDGPASESEQAPAADDYDPDPDEPTVLEPQGLKSRKALGRMYEITSQNDVERQRALGDMFMTVSDLDEMLLRAWLMAGARIV